MWKWRGSTSLPTSANGSGLGEDAPTGSYTFTKLMRIRSGAIEKLLCILALFVALTPGWSFGSVQPMSCGLKAQTSCKMPCCLGAPKTPKLCCAKQASSHRILHSTDRLDRCRCQIHGGVPQASAPQGLVQPTAVAALTCLSLSVAHLNLERIPGIFGFDSGPPTFERFAPDLGRAPPAA